MRTTEVTPLHPLPAELPAPGGRLAELVAHLTGCAPVTAVDAVEHALPGAGDPPGAPPAGLSLDERLDVVARALLSVRRERSLDLRERRTSPRSVA